MYDRERQEERENAEFKLLRWGMVGVGDIEVLIQEINLSFIEYIERRDMIDIQRSATIPEHLLDHIRMMLGGL